MWTSHELTHLNSMSARSSAASSSSSLPPVPAPLPPAPAAPAAAPRPPARNRASMNLAMSSAGLLARCVASRQMAGAQSQGHNLSAEATGYHHAHCLRPSCTRAPAELDVTNPAPPQPLAIYGIRALAIPAASHRIAPG